MTNNLLKFSADLDRKQLPTNQAESELTCHVNIKPNVFAGNENEVQTSASICLVFDCSFSMHGKKFETAIKTAKMIVDILHERHFISLVTFQTVSDVLFKHAIPLEWEKESIKKQIDKLDDHLGGSTNMAAGIEKGMGILTEGIVDSDAGVMIILSDGEPNSSEDAQTVADAASQKGIQIYAVGIGDSYNADQLLRIVTPSNGAVFGDSDENKINEIFYDIINRIDRIFAAKVKLTFTFDERVKLQHVYKTSPERALYDSLKIDDNNTLELQVGHIEDNKVYEFLLQLKVGSHDIGTVELVRAKLQYDINQLGISKQQDLLVILTVDYIENDSLDLAEDKKITSAMKSASMMQLSDELIQACSRSDNDRALELIDRLEKRCDEENNSGLQQHLDHLKNQIAKGRKISDKDRNEFLVASTIAPPEEEVLPVPIVVEETIPIIDIQPVVETPIRVNAEKYELILTYPGPETIRLLREIRNATSMGVKEITQIIQRKDGVITAFENLADAEQLQQRLLNIDAKVFIKASDENEEILDDATISE